MTIKAKLFHSLKHTTIINIEIDMSFSMNVLPIKPISPTPYSHSHAHTIADCHILLKIEEVSIDFPVGDMNYSR